MKSSARVLCLERIEQPLVPGPISPRTENAVNIREPLRLHATEDRNGKSAEKKNPRSFERGPAKSVFSYVSGGPAVGRLPVPQAEPV
ncbi:hypothetical protein CO656_04350 [Sinorhizobium sp. FG01]|uniref:Uncharacterized protein n=1 Tax=Sinorhizobium americanum TaxID=194963 RepID=A0A2S3YPL9_9HYPH|nr:hypothetical protein CO656_04350 [Sinorhizobium sp. FG01]POH32811.1 hypothetical protein ATY31_13000 [Sinorhizobium americanum]